MSGELEAIDAPDRVLSDGFVRDVFYIALNCGKILLENGAETYRIEDTMARIADNYGIDNTQVFVTPTVIIFSMNDYALTQTVRIDERANNLEKIDSINNLSRRIAGGLPLRQAIDQLGTIHDTRIFPFWMVVLSGAIIGVSFLMLFEGVTVDIPAAVIAGAGGVFIMEGIQRYTKIKFFTEFFAAVFIAMAAILYAEYGPGQMLDTIVISSVMPLVPGVLITNAIREMIRGHLLAGVIKGAEAALTAIAIGAGVALVYMLL
ncbi:threonine/serine exporter family protein [Salinicoccus albus]|uniref:threonine/serine exporter family protein n=1 Tax=Salinicoccus albus TaxID=418756 RepID=UPI0003A28C75|nr:threonine/serine exporter family protein [Salinicoccus albus]